MNAMKMLPHLTAAFAAFALVASPAPRASAQSALTGSFPTTFYPPRTAQFAGPGPVAYAAVGVLVRNVSFSAPTAALPLPTVAGANTQVSATLTFAAEISANAGATWTPATAPAASVMRITRNATGTFDTEMLSLNITGGLGAGVMVRESPTRQSLGSATVTPGGGLFKIDSFFDIFTELSVNGGAAWIPSAAALHVDMSRMAQELSADMNFLPPPGKWLQVPGGGTATFMSQTVIVRGWDFKHKRCGVSPPGAAGPAVQSFFDVFVCEMSLDGGATFHALTADAEGSLRFSSSNVTGSFDTEMLSMSLSAPRPDGAPGTVMLRESPTRASTGKTTVRGVVSGGSMISSFFDIFTEVSLDGGQSWSPSSVPVRLECAPPELTRTVPTDFFPSRGSRLSVRTGTPPVLYSSGSLATFDTGMLALSLSSPAGLSLTGLPVGGPPQNISLPVSSAFTLQHPPQAAARATATGDATLRVTRNTTGSFDTEMLALNLSGTGFMLRESPTRASTGKTTLQVLPGGGYAIDSFFDIFTELSVDGGATWQPADKPVRAEGTAQDTPEFATSPFLPLRGRHGDGGSLRYHYYMWTNASGPQVMLGSASLESTSATLRQPPPAPGAPAMISSFFDVFVCDLSLDGGQTYIRCYCNCDGSLRTSPGTQSFDTEMLALNLSGGTLPPGVMIRESPTRQSTGKTTIVPAAGGHRIGSFFDIFTEISLDGGLSWNAANRTLHLEHNAVPHDTVASSDTLPPPGRYVLRPGSAGAKTASGVSITRLSMDSSTGGQPPPASGETLTTELVALQCEVEIQGGPVGTTRAFPGFVYWTTTTQRSSDSLFDTEMLALNISGGSLPPGMMLRESPTLKSTGKTTVVPNGGGTHRIGSFFDIFVEVSLDGGQTWEATDKPLRLDLTPPDTLVTKPQPNFVKHLTQSAAGGGDGSEYPNGAVASFFDVFFDIAVTDVDLSTMAAGSTANGSLQGDSDFHLGLAAGQPPVAGTGDASATFRVTHVQDSGGTRFFDTEMLSLNIAGGSLPTTVRVRESPSKASLGRTTLTPLPGGTYRIGSFFDIFTEISLDGGQSWSPSDGSMRIGAAPVPPPAGSMPTHFAATDFLPPPGRIVLGGSMMLPDGTVLSNMSFEPSPDSPRVPAPPAGMTAQCQTSGFFHCSVTSPTGGAGSQVLPATMTLLFTGASSGTERFFDTEMLALNIQSSAFRIRESPSKPSTGLTRISDAPGGGFMVDSFFDIFTELSVDGGQSWTPSSGPPAHGNLEPQAVAVELPTNFFPPRGGELRTLKPGTQLIFPPLVVRNLVHRNFQNNAPLAPPPGGAQNISAPHTAVFETSSDGGQTWQPQSAPASATMRVTHSPTGFFDTEMLQLNIAGGTLPAGVMIRESPTLPSRGRTSVQPQSGGSYMIDSFFDIFTELSVDGGQSWQPATGPPAHVELMLPPQEQLHASNFLPLNGMMSTLPSQPPVFYAPRTAVKYGQCWVFGTEVPRAEPPPPGQTRQFTITQDMFMDYSDDSGVTFVPVTASATMTLSFTNSGGTGTQGFDTEMLQLNLQGGDLPQGTMIRESPTRASTGRTTIRPVDGGFMIDSFFDIFTEISLDGGQHWLPGSEPVHFEHTESQRTIVAPAKFPARAPLATAPGGSGARTAGGVMLNSLELHPLTSYGGAPPPRPGQSTDVSEDYTVTILWTPPGQAQQQEKFTGRVVLRLTPRDALGAGPPAFDTEMLQLDLTGSSGFRLRESPTRASTGKTTFQETADDSFRIGSFFDIFVECSLDGGQSWLPTDQPLHAMLLPAVQKVRSRASVQLPEFRLSRSSGNVGTDFPVGSALPGGGAGSGKVSMQDFHFVMRSPAPPLPLPGTLAVADLDADGRLDFIMPGGSPVSAPVSFQGQMRVGQSWDTGGTRTFDTEMLSLNITGTSLPAGMLIRESPTLPSRGKTTQRTMPDGAYQIDSFFDIFTEISLDNGTTWSPSDGPMRLDGGTQSRILTGPGGSAPPRVRAFTAPGTMLDNFLAYQDNFTGGVRVATGDVNGDGVCDIITGAGPGGGPHVKVFDGRTGAACRDFFAYGSSFAGGVFVASGDVNGDGRDDIITGAGPGAAPHVKVFDGATGGLLQSFFAYAPTFAGGVAVAAGDVNGDGLCDIITGSGTGGNAHVKAFSGQSGAELRSFFAYPGFTGGVFVAAGDLNGDGAAEIVTGYGAGGAPHVKVFNGASGALLLSFFAYDTAFAGGVRVAAGDVNGDGIMDIITGPGAGMAPQVRVFNGSTAAELESFLAYGTALTTGIYVADTPPERSSTNPTDADGDGLLDSWETRHWGTIDGHDDTDDSDRDGVPDMLELGFDLNPLKPDISGLPPAAVENGYLTMTITKRPGALYTVRSGTTTTGLRPDDTTILQNDETTLKVRDNVPFATGPRRFMDVLVTSAP